MPIRITGMVSGLDTEAIVSAMVSAYSAKKTKSQKSVQTMKWKQDAWSSLNTKIKSLYSSVSSLRFTSAYSLKKATVSDPTKATVSASANAVKGSQKLVVNDLAKAGYLTGAQLSKGTTSSTKLSDLDPSMGSGSVSVSVGGKTTDIEVTADMTVGSFVNKLKEAGVSANFDEKNGRIFVASKESGKDNDFTLVGNDGAGVAALSALGLNAKSTANKALYESYAAYSGMSQDEIEATLAQIETNKNTISTLTSDNAAYNDQLKYANDYKSSQDKIASTNLTSDEKAELESHLSNGNTKSFVGDKITIDGQERYVYYDKEEEIKDEDGNITGYRYTSTDGEITSKMTSPTKLKTIEERVQELAEQDNSDILTTEVEKKDAEGNVETDGEGNPIMVRQADSSKISSLYSELQSVKTFEADDSNSSFVSDVQTAYADPAGIEGVTSAIQSNIDANDAEIAAAKTYNTANKFFDTGEDAATIYNKIQQYTSLLNDYDSAAYSDAVRVNGQDAEIYLNDAKYTSSSNSFVINDLTINVTGTTDAEGITISTDTDTQAIYDKIKDFLKQYNEIINEMNKLYNADSAKGYEPLTDEEKSEMSDDEVEKWEQKIKDSILRRDDTLGSVINAMTTSMYASYNIGDKGYSLASFGIKTKSYFEVSDNDNYAYHIDGDKDDDYSSGNSDKLLQAITEDADSVVNFFQKLSEGLYKSLDNKMKSSSLSSAYTVYNDKQMKSQLSDYEQEVSDWEDKISDYEDYWFNKYAVMESTLAKLQSQTSSLASFMG